MVNAGLLPAAAGGGAPRSQGWNIRFNLSIYRMKATAGVSAGRAGNSAAAAMTLESKRFTMRTKVVNNAAA
jgi:hypothetical protein